MEISDTLKFQDEVKVSLDAYVPTVEDIVRRRIEDSPLDKILNDLGVVDPYADLGK